MPPDPPKASLKFPVSFQSPKATWISANSRRDEGQVIVVIFTEPEVTNCFSKIALVIFRENKTKLLNLRLRNINKSGRHFENWKPFLL